MSKIRIGNLLAIACGLCIAAPPPVGAQTDDLAARDWFYSAKDMVGKAPVKAKVPPRPSQPPSNREPPPSAGGNSLKLVSNNSLGLRYSLLKKAASGYIETRPDSLFQAGDKIRLHVTSNAPGYLYIVQRGSSGNWTPLFPSPEINGGRNEVEPGKEYEIPGGSGEDFELDEHSGVEQIFILLTRKPEPDLDKIVQALRGTSTADGPLIDDSIVRQFRSEVQPRDLIFTKGGANYVVNTNPDSKPDPRVVVDVKLTHR
ncbi:MAG: DUF4384 domain-containing protein [Acidobacteriota bacterium]|nr:DUF4384 domain-containing protein [Acidobacteriota bacterium]